MKETDLLLTTEEQHIATGDNFAWGQKVTEREDAICRAQAAKVLAVLQHQGRTDFTMNQFLRDVVAETGLAWSKEDT